MSKPHQKTSNPLSFRSKDKAHEAQEPEWTSESMRIASTAPRRISAETAVEQRSFQVIEEAVAMQRWEQALALFEFWVQVWKDNPHLAAQAGKRVEEFMMPLEEVRKRRAQEWGIF